MEPTLDDIYWNDRYQAKSTGWDIGDVSTPLKEYIDQLTDKNISILIPGCGNAYEAAYLLEKGFTNIHLLDISPLLVENLKRKFKLIAGDKLHFICDDFFNISGQYDLVIEQTFFCALNPNLRKKYVEKMHEILAPGGKLAGVLFNRDFIGGPPFGGNSNEYQQLFSSKFQLKTMEPCYNSIEPRAGSEVFIILQKK